MCPSCVHRVNIGRLRVCVGSILAFNQIRGENRAKFKISYSCGHRVSKSARYDATLMIRQAMCSRFLPLDGPNGIDHRIAYHGMKFNLPEYLRAKQKMITDTMVSTF